MCFCVWNELLSFNSVEVSKTILRLLQNSGTFLRFQVFEEKTKERRRETNRRIVIHVDSCYCQITRYFYCGSSRFEKYYPASEDYPHLAK